ncbi:MAG: cyclic nucleotide-binding domain-containing protein [Chitinivibrionales bacterium]|nr:cyclic nucleotide-binding domain-containing protein [Chitinivibrionales bacterium]MBD3358408.1 cyclic nucleotide-binding domain-containing protein [Chitinivibrionales bacterium]
MKYYTRKRREYAPGELILSENGSPNGMYIIESGKVRVYKISGVGAAKREIFLGTLGPQAIFGEMAMLDDRPRSASVRAIKPTVCTIINRDMLVHQLTAMPSWLLNVIRILITRIRGANDSLRESVSRYATCVDDDPGGLIMAKTE